MTITDFHNYANIVANEKKKLSFWSLSAASLLIPTPIKKLSFDVAASMAKWASSPRSPWTWVTPVAGADCRGAARCSARGDWWGPGLYPANMSDDTRCDRGRSRGLGGQTEGMRCTGNGDNMLQPDRPAGKADQKFLYLGLV